MKNDNRFFTVFWLILIAALTASSQNIPSLVTADTLIHYQLNDSDAATVAGGSIPNLGNLGNGSNEGTGITLTNNLPTLGVPPGLGNRAIVCDGSSGIKAPGTKQLDNSIIAANGGYTFEVWFNWNGSGDVNGIIDYAGTEKLRRGTTQPSVGSTINSITTTPIGTSSSNTWHYVASVFTTTNPVVGGTITGDFTYYLDGNTPILTNGNVTISDFGDSLNRTIGVGMHPQAFAADFFNGLLYEPRVSLGALTDQELLFKNVITVTNDSGIGSLRNAVSIAPEHAIITFDNSLAEKTITLTSGQILVDKSLTIDASNIGGISIDAGNASRIFEIVAGTTNIFNTLNLTGGTAPAGTEPSRKGGFGGGILNQGTLSLIDCHLYDNSAGAGYIPALGESGNDGNGGDGGGIYNSGNLTVLNSTLSGNSSGNGGFGFAGGSIGGHGGGIYNSGVLNLINSTLTENSTGTGENNDHRGSGGGIYTLGNTTLLHCTLIENSVDQGDTFPGLGYGIFNVGGPVSITNSIIAEIPASPIVNISGSITDSNNLFHDAPLLAPLGNYGGPTPSMPPLSGSPAIDTGVTILVTDDQRGAPRSDGMPDIGAVEFQRIVVNTLADENDGLSVNNISLRDAIAHNASFPYAHHIEFTNPLSGQTILLTNGQLAITNSLSLDASTIGGITIDGNAANRIFEVFGSNTAATLNALTLTNGHAIGDFGGGIYLHSGANLTLRQCTLSGNSAFRGGGIFNEQGTLSLWKSTLSGNSANFGGGGIRSLTSDADTLPITSSTTLNQCTLTDNTDGSNGGGVRNDNGFIFMTNCTV